VHPGSVSLLGCLVPPAFLLEFPQVYQIFTTSNGFSSWGRERSQLELSLASTVGENNCHLAFSQKFLHNVSRMGSCIVTVSTQSFVRQLSACFLLSPPSNALEHCNRTLY
jgi:hypothetical protein